MGVKCWINGKNYDVVQGVTISEEYNETLDSGNLIISNVSQIDLKPYDDVIIYESIDKDGNLYELDGWETGVIPDNLIFYKHLLIDQFTEEILYLGDETGEFDKFGNPIVENMKFKYRIQLFSETKKLETIQLPNISVTQPLKESERKIVYKILEQFLEVYNVKEKIAVDTNKKIFEYKNKYVLDPSLKEVFENVYAPEFSMNNPNLKDVISQLFITRDRIPYVENNVIKDMDISARNGNFDVKQGEINFITGSYSSDNYCSNLKRTYSDALSQESTGKSIEYVGFRNSNTPLMTLENMRLELEFPIYKINKVYMCYYKQVSSNYVDENGSYVQEPVKFLCKQDITPLIKLDSERNNLSQDWDDFNTKKPDTIEEMAKYKLCTLGYSIGSNFIDGWGTRYSYPRGWWQADGTASYLENILRVLDRKYPYGILNTEDFYNAGFYVSGSYTNLSDSIYPVEDKITNVLDGKLNLGYMLKTMFFIVDYTPFYNGTIIHSKNIENRNDSITVNDNPSSSLTLLEMDGISQNEKLNRFGNKGMQINARYKDTTQLQPLGSVFNRGKEKDIVIHHREYSIFDNIVLCSYNGSKDYVLKNYFTNVYAKHRTYNLMSYGESVKRAENKKTYLFLSKNNYYNELNPSFNYQNFDAAVISKLLSFYNSIKLEEIAKTDTFTEKDKINIALFKYNNGKEKGYLFKDINVFTSGNSLCLNVTTKDNIVSSPYIKNLIPDYDFLDATQDMIGSTQDFKMFTDDYGYLNNLDFIFGHVDKDFFKFEEIEKSDSYKIRNQFKDYLSQIPYLDEEKSTALLNSMKNIISLKNINNDEGYNLYKDNKEVIDMTYQFETITDDENIMFSPWLMKLSDLSDVYKKFDQNLRFINSNGYLARVFAYFSNQTMISYNMPGPFNYHYTPEIILKLDKTDLFSVDEDGNKILELNGTTYETGNDRLGYYTDYDNNWYITGFSSTLDKLTITSNQEVILQGYVHLTYVKYAAGEYSKKYKVTQPFEKKMDKLLNINNLMDFDYYDFYRVRFESFVIEIEGENVVFNEEKQNIITAYNYFIHPESNYDLSKYIYDVDADKVIDKDELINVQFVVSPIKVDNREFVDINYYKNLYFVKAPTLNQVTVYDEFKDLPFDVDDSIKFSFSVDPYPILKISFDGESYLPGDSIRLYYRNNSDFSKKEDGNYHFVFGINLFDIDINNGYVEVYFSLLNNKDLFIKDSKNKIIGKLYNYVNTPNKMPDKDYYEEI